MVNSLCSPGENVQNVIMRITIRGKNVVRIDVGIENDNSSRIRLGIKKLFISTVDDQLIMLR